MELVTLAILAGGSSSRFGAPKRRVERDGRWLLQDLVERWRPAVKSILLAGPPAEIGEDAARLGITPVADSWSDSGPLAGIHAALIGCGTDWLFVLPCDMPRAPVAAAERFHSRAGRDDDAVLLELGGIPVPVCGLYHRRIAPHIAASIAAGERKITRALTGARLSCMKESELMANGLAPRDFASFNTPDELRQLFS